MLDNDLRENAQELLFRDMLRLLPIKREAISLRIQTALEEHRSIVSDSIFSVINDCFNLWYQLYEELLEKIPVTTNGIQPRS